MQKAQLLAILGLKADGHPARMKDPTVWSILELPPDGQKTDDLLAGRIEKSSHAFDPVATDVNSSYFRLKAVWLPS